MPSHLRLKRWKYSNAVVLQNLNAHRVTAKLQDVLLQIILCLGLHNIRDE